MFPFQSFCLYNSHFLEIIHKKYVLMNVINELATHYLNVCREPLKYFNKILSKVTAYVISQCSLKNSINAMFRNERKVATVVGGVQKDNSV